MKKAFALLIALLLTVCTASAEENSWYLETAAEAAARLGELVGDDVYLQMMTSQTFDLIETLQAADFSAVSTAYRYATFDDAAVESMIYLLSGGEMSKAGLSAISSKFPQTILSLHTGGLGSEALAVSSMLTYNYTSVMPEGFEPCFLLLALDSAAVSVSFCKTGENTITIQAQPFFYDENLTPEEAVADFTPYDAPVFPIASEKLL